jgi:uncharacterized membrane protein (UPF0127 family)
MKNRYAPMLVAACVLIAASQPSVAQQKLPVIPLSIGIHMIKAEVAANDADRQQGLMFRQSMGGNEGMVFVFDAPAKVCMWMKNTYLPLSVAFLDKEGRILNIEEMRPQTTESHCAVKPARYALEMNQGWFKKKNISSGAQVTGLPK